MRPDKVIWSFLQRVSSMRQEFDWLKCRVKIEYPPPHLPLRSGKKISLKRLKEIVLNLMISCSPFRSRLNDETFEIWLSLTITHTFNPESSKIFGHSRMWPWRNWALSFVSGTALTTYETVSFNPATMKDTTPLYSSFSSSAQLISRQNILLASLQIHLVENKYNVLRNFPFLFQCPESVYCVNNSLGNFF